MDRGEEHLRDGDGGSTFNTTHTGLADSCDMADVAAREVKACRWC
jgi:hypothetical protein